MKSGVFFGGKGFDEEENIHGMSECFAFLGCCGCVGFGEQVGGFVKGIGFEGIALGMEIGFVFFDAWFFGAWFVCDKEGDIFGGHEGALQAGLFGGGVDIGRFELSNRG